MKQHRSQVVGFTLSEMMVVSGYLVWREWSKRQERQRLSRFKEDVI